MIQIVALTLALGCSTAIPYNLAVSGKTSIGHPQIAQNIPPEYQDLERFRQDFETRYVASESMNSTLEVGDKILLDKHTYRSKPPERGDIILFDPPSYVNTGGVEGQFVFRVVGLPGETVEIRQGQTHINNIPLQEGYITRSFTYDYGPDQVPEDSYFVLGDNRDSANDSHQWGALPRENIISKVIGIYCPVERQITLDSQSREGKNQSVFSGISDFFQDSPSLCSLQNELP